MIYLDATAIDTWLRCREEYRQLYLENRVPTEPSIHLAFGHAVHKAVEFWHKGWEYEKCLYIASQEMEVAAGEMEGRLRPDMEIKWRELALALPEVVAVYCDGVEPCGNQGEIEQEFKIEYRFGIHVILVGKIDRYSEEILTDVKTASEIGRTWKADYRATLLRTFQFGLYDWYLRNRGDQYGSAGSLPGAEGGNEPVISVAPRGIKVECIVKPYRGKPARLEVFDLPEIAVYRKRFDKQLAWVVREIVEYHERYQLVKPWPMASSQTCQGKFSQCDYLKICNGGESEKILAGYKPREEHLVYLQSKS